MKKGDPGRIVFLILIAGRKQKNDLSTALSGCGVRLTNVIYGKGTAQAGFLQSVLGLVPEENKAVITGMLPQERSDPVFKMLVDQFHFDEPNTGIAFIIPIDKLSYK